MGVRVEQVLQIIQQQQRPPRRQESLQCAINGLRSSRLHANSVPYRGSHKRRLPNRRQWNEPHPIGKSVGGLLGNPKGETSLTHPARTGEGYQPNLRLTKHGDQRRHDGFAANKAREWCWEARTHCRWISDLNRRRRSDAAISWRWVEHGMSWGRGSSTSLPIMPVILGLSLNQLVPYALPLSKTWCPQPI